MNIEKFIFNNGQNMKIIYDSAIHKYDWGNFLDFFKSNSTVIELEIVFINLEQEEMDQFCQILKSDKILKSIIFTFHFDNKEINQLLCESLKFNSNLNSLYIYYYIINDPNYIVYIMSQILKENKSLKEFHFNLIRCYSEDIDEYSISSFSESLKLNNTLTLLNLNSNNIRDATNLFEGLKFNKSINHLEIESNYLNSSCMQALNNTLIVNSTLNEINLFDNEIGDIGCSYLNEGLKLNTSLTKLNLSLNKISYIGAKILSDILKVNTSLKYLDLSSNILGEDGVNYLSDALKVNNTLIELNLGVNKFGDLGANSLSEALKVNKSLSKLSINHNGINDLGIISLCDALKVNSTLKSLDLKSNSFGYLGVHSLSILLLKSSLNDINLSNDIIDDEGVIILSKSLKYNTNLKKLYLNQSKIGYYGLLSLKDALDINNSLEILHISSYISNGGKILKQSKNSTLIDLLFDIYLDHNFDSLEENPKMN